LICGGRTTAAVTVAVAAAAGAAWRCGCRAALTTSIEMLQSKGSDGVVT